MLPLKESIKRPTITHICIFSVNSASFWHCYSLLGYYYTHARSKLLIHRVLEVRCFNFFNLRFNVLNNIKLLWLNNKTTLLLRSSFFGYCWDYCQRLIIFNPIRIAHPVLHSVQTNRRFVHFALRAMRWSVQTNEKGLATSASQTKSTFWPSVYLSIVQLWRLLSARGTLIPDVLDAVKEEEV